MNRFARCAAGSAILGVLVAHAISWSPSQLLWACHIASLAIAGGLVFDSRRWIAAGVLFHAAQGIPIYVIDLVLVGDNSATSVLGHTVPILVGACALWGKPLPRGVVLRAWLIPPFAMLAAYLLADPKLNVMLVHEPYAPTAGLFPALWMSWIAYLAMSITALAIGWVALRAIWGRWS